MDFGPSTEKIAPIQPLFPEKTSELIVVYAKIISIIRLFQPKSD